MKDYLFVYEAPDDSGGDVALDDDSGDDDFQSIFTEGGWAQRAGGDVAPVSGEDDTEATPPAEEPPAEPAATLPEGWDEADWAQFQREYPGRTPAQLWQEHKNLRTAFSRGEHKQPAEEPRAAEGPPTWSDPNKYAVLGPIPQDGLSNVQRQALGELMQEDPKAAAHWAAANAHLLTEPEFAAVQSNWYQADPYGASQAWERAKMEAEHARQQEEYGPRMGVIDEGQQMHGIALAEAAIPDFAEHKQDFAKWIEENPQIDEYLGTMKTPEQVRDALTVVYYQRYGPDLAGRLREAETARAEAQAAADKAAADSQAAAEQANQRARTATRTAPPAGGGGEASADDIRAAIRGARR